MKKYLIPLLIIWLLSIAGFVMQVVELDYVRMFVSGAWLIFVTMKLGKIARSFYVSTIKPLRKEFEETNRKHGWYKNAALERKEELQNLLGEIRYQEDLLEKLKKEKMEIVESLANLDGFKLYKKEFDDKCKILGM